MKSMPSRYSIYSVIQAEPPKWLPGEELAATSFIAMTFLLMLEINVEIHRVFKRRQGIYFWAVQIGSIGCAFDALGLILKFLVANTRIWPLYTLLMSVGWVGWFVASIIALR